MRDDAVAGIRARSGTTIGERRMQRVTITIDDELMTELDRIIAARGYQNRSEAIRDLARAGIREAGETLDAKRDCVAALVYIYDHAARELPKRLTETFHDHHELSLSSLHVHLDHDSCMEVTVLKGKTGAVQHFAEHVIAERGVRHGRVVMMPTGRGPRPAPPQTFAREAFSREAFPGEAFPRQACARRIPHLSAGCPCAPRPRYAILCR
jgi:CopG family transcriptional regulator, nickel-responsive regulator